MDFTAQTCISLLNFVFWAISKIFWTGPKYFWAYRNYNLHFHEIFIQDSCIFTTMLWNLWAEDKNAGFLNFKSIWLFAFSVQCLHFCVTKSLKIVKSLSGGSFFFQTADKARINLCSIIHSSLLLLSKIMQMVLQYYCCCYWMLV